LGGGERVLVLKKKPRGEGAKEEDKMLQYPKGGESWIQTSAD